MDMAGINVNITTAELLIIYVVVVVIVDIVTWKAGIPLKMRILYAFIPAIILLFFKLILGMF